MKLAMPTKRYKGFTRIEESAREQIEGILAGCSPLFGALAESVQHRLIETLRPEAQRTLLHALEGRTQEQEELSGFDWKDTLAEMTPTPLRQEAIQLITEQQPELARGLDEPELVRRNTIEWLYDQTVGRIQKSTPYLVGEEKALGRWKQECPEAYALAERAATKGAASYQDRSRREKTAPPRVSDEARDLSRLAHMIAARKLYCLAVGLNEYFEKEPKVIAVKLPSSLQTFRGNRVHVRVGTTGRPVQYRPVSAEQVAAYRQMLDSPMLLALQQKVCPWTADNNLTRRIDCNILAKAYWGIVRANAARPPGPVLHEPTLQTLGNIQRYRLLGFREDIVPEQTKILEDFLAENKPLQDFLAGNQAAFKAHRLDQSVVQLALNTAVAGELARIGRKWNPGAVAQGEEVRALVPLIIQDLSHYHDRLMQTDFLALKGQNFFKEELAREYMAHAPPKERTKMESFYRPMAVVLVARNDRHTGPIPAGWEEQRTYVDNVSGAQFTDYTVNLEGRTAIVCLQQGADPAKATEAAQKLLDLANPPQINDGTARIKGVRISVYSYNELTASCLRPVSIARMQFYTSFSAKETVDLLRGTTDEPTTENVIEVLKPCFILRYSDAYARVKPAQMVRVKYRTPTGEKKNPCWDASRILGGLKETDARYQERLEDPGWGLVLIEGEKKAALLAQMFIERDLPYHVIALPGVWMGLDRQRNLVEEIGRFQMQAPGQRRDCFIFFDNDKAYKAGVTDAMLALAKSLQKVGANVFIPNLPFGRHVKGADDFALVHCKGGSDYQPLLDIIENASYVPEKVRAVKYPSAEQEQEINQHLAEAERIHELQDKIGRSAAPAESPELRELWLLQAAYRPKPGLEALRHLETLTPAGRENLLKSVLSENPALDLLRHACQHIPRFEDGPNPREVQTPLSPIPAQPVLELYA